jgi:protein-disulfide isomerase/uncharacterized membrane protein
MPSAHPAPDTPRSSAESALLPPVILAWLGAIIAFLLLQPRPEVRMLFCPAKASCEAVLASQYGRFLGIPLPWAGAAFYLGLLTLLLGAYGSSSGVWRARWTGISVWLSVAGLAFSGMLMWVQFGKLHAFCALCTASAAVVAGLVATTLRAERLLASAPPAGAHGAAWTLAIVMLMAIFGLAWPAIATPGEVVAVVDGQRFTRAQMESDLNGELRPLRVSVYEREFAWVRGKVDAALLAADAGQKNVSVEQLLAGRTGTSRDELLAQIAASHRVEVRLKKPPLRDLRIDLSLAEVAGPPDAKVQLVVFSDFECDFCAKLAPVLARVREEFPRDVLVAYRYFPLETHSRALPSAIAAACAAEQGAFWKYHDALFSGARSLSDERLSSLAGELGLDLPAFETCRTSGKARQTVEASFADGARLGIDGAPSLFLNGTLIGGFVEYDALAQRIRAVLAGR